MIASSRAGARGILAAFVALVFIVSACSGGSTTAVTEATTTEPTTTTSSVATTTTTNVPPTTTTTLDIEVPDPLPIDPPESYELVWSDEFDGDSIDPANWTYDIGGWGWGNGEAQYYTDRPENARVQNGLLVIEAVKEQFEGNPYTSARMLTMGLREFQYGYIEARLKVPDGVGTWPAFWMLGANFGRDTEDPDDSIWPNVGEIDIMEYAGKEPDLVLGTIHGPGYSGAGGLSRWNRQDFSIADDFHTFAVDWDENGIRWYFDGEEYYNLTPESVGDMEWVFDQPFFIIVNLALGGTIGGLIPVDTEFPQYLLVDHVRVYQRVESS